MSKKTVSPVHKSAIMFIIASEREAHRRGFLDTSIYGTLAKANARAKRIKASGKRAEVFKLGGSYYVLHNSSVSIEVARMYPKLYPDDARIIARKGWRP